MANDITITVGGKSTTQPAVDRSIGDLKRLQGGVAQVGKTLGGLKGALTGFATLWGFRRISSGLHNVLGNLDEIGDRLGGTLGQQAHQASDAFGDLRDELRGITDEIAGRMSPAMTVLAKDLKQTIAGTGARDGLGSWFEEKTNQASVLIEKFQELHKQSAAVGGIGVNDALKLAFPLFDDFETMMGLGGSGAVGSKKVEALKSDNAEAARIKGMIDAQLAAQGQGFASAQARDAAETAAAQRQAKAQADWDKFSAPAVGKAAAGKAPQWGALGGRGMDAARKEFDRAQKDAQAAKQDDADRLRAALAPAPGLAPREANRLTRGLGVNVDPADQAFYAAKMGAVGKGGAPGGNDPQIKKITSCLRQSPRRSKSSANRTARGCFNDRRCTAPSARKLPRPNRSDRSDPRKDRRDRHDHDRVKQPLGRVAQANPGRDAEDHQATAGRRPQRLPARLTERGSRPMILQSGKRGHVRKIFPERGFGFVRVRDSGESVFFHVKDCLPALLAGGDFDESLLEREVAFDLCDGPKGPRAANVRPG